jgi:hypothetical protein
VVDPAAAGSGPIWAGSTSRCDRDIDGVDWDAWAAVERILESTERVIVGEC